MAKKISLSAIRHLLQGILDGTLEIHYREGARSKTAAAANAGRPKTARRSPGRRRKPGRKPMSPSARQKALLRAKREKLRQARQALPTPRQIFEALHGKTDGLKLSALAKHFQAPRTLLKGLLAKLVKKNDIQLVKDVYYLRRRIRTGEGSAARKSPPIEPAAVLAYLEEHPGATLVEMTKSLGAESYQKLNKVINLLKRENKVVVNGKSYSLA
ncbi:MAG: hypothetical protein OZSIB_3412 [Candidatus Ozemobacter sibiricus]|jgi:hypothetical protein|uniref:Uncharacterized protein n=1 Tax=Candidatus Ozemobacter sibiricus TaxID=2268124 RepID=A0A367ZQB7_9BACT|nr:MAG: hypothetical protein OZSIB_3412 [Candidatus Ozemobacter sibiricus]